MKYKNIIKASLNLRNDLPKIKDREYVINLDKCKSIGALWIALYLNRHTVTYFDSFGVEYILKESKNSYSPKISQQIFIEYKQIVQKCVDTLVLHLLILFWKIKAC